MQNIGSTNQGANDFDGDCVLANSILFLQDFGWWIEIAYAILKVWIFTFAGVHYEASADLHNGILNNWLVNITADLLQEHYNHWLKDMEEIENAFALHSHSKTHTSPHLCNELQVLLALYKEENLHLFCAGWMLGLAANNQFNEGYRGLDSSKLNDFISNETRSSTNSCSSQSDSVCSSTPSSASSSTQSEDDNMNEDDPSNNQLIGGSDYDSKFSIY
ncbi:hypothetical protein L208DRAFT_1422760 [Tricholoma matsutake]|nr:hypothetical protein L208DRAFT_1422760 [Tricholoma matsutake 945]